MGATPGGVSKGLCSSSEHEPRPSVKRSSPTPVQSLSPLLSLLSVRQTDDSGAPSLHPLRISPPPPQPPHPLFVSPIVLPADIIWGNVGLRGLWLETFDCSPISSGLLSGERENVLATSSLSFKIATKGKSYFLPETVLVYQDAFEMQSQTALAGDLA